MLLQINLALDTPVYRQIADALRPGFIEGRLTPGDALPTIRQLAADLGVHFNTVAEAYRLLAEEGWLELRRGRGAVVVERKMPQSNQAGVNDFSRRLRELVADWRARGVLPSAVAHQLRLLAEELEP